MYSKLTIISNWVPAQKDSATSAASFTTCHRCELIALPRLTLHPTLSDIATASCWQVSTLFPFAPWTFPTLRYWRFSDWIIWSSQVFFRSISGSTTSLICKRRCEGLHAFTWARLSLHFWIAECQKRPLHSFSLVARSLRRDCAIRPHSVCRARRAYGRSATGGEKCSH